MTGNNEQIFERVVLFINGDTRRKTIAEIVLVTVQFLQDVPITDNVSNRRGYLYSDTSANE